MSTKQLLNCQSVELDKTSHDLRHPTFSLDILKPARLYVKLHEHAEMWEMPSVGLRNMLYLPNYN